MQAEHIARLFHETYERLAPDYGYEIRKESAVPWTRVPDTNKRLMIAVAGEVGCAIEQQIDRDLRAIVGELYALAERGLTQLDGQAYDAWELQLMAATVCSHNTSWKRKQVRNVHRLQQSA